MLWKMQKAMTSNIKGGVALNKSMDSSFMLTFKKTEYVKTDAGGWIDVLIGVYKILFKSVLCSQ